MGIIALRKQKKLIGESSFSVKSCINQQDVGHADFEFSPIVSLIKPFSGSKPPVYGI